MGAEKYIYMVVVVVVFKKRDVVVWRYIFTYFPDTYSNPVINHLSAVLNHQDKVIRVVDSFYF